MYLATDTEKKDSAAGEFEMFEVFYWVAQALFHMKKETTN